MPERSQQATLRALGNRGLRDLTDRYVAAWENNDVSAFTSLLVEDASFAMPPLTTWYTPRDTIAIWARRSSMSGAWRWRTVPTRANGQPALAFYAWDEPSSSYLPFALNVLTLEGDLVRDVTAFIVRSIESPDPEAYERFPEQPMDSRRLSGTFERLGLPDRVA